jgi:hypothetical protein
MLEGADQNGDLELEDLERLATTAYFAGRDEESEAAWARAHQAFLDKGDHERATGSATWLAFGLLQRGAHAPASGWFTYRTATDFREALKGDYSGAFSDVVFAIADWSSERKFLGPFRDVFAATGPS